MCNHMAKKALAERFIKLKGAIVADVERVDPEGLTNLMAFVESISDSWPTNYKLKYIKTRI